jgi:hypothetical protein
VTSAVSLGNNTSIAFQKETDQQARRWNKYDVQDYMADILPNDRVAWCMKHRQTGSDQIEITYDQAQQRAFYSNLLTCGSVWTCPVCAARITEHRRVELSQAIEQWRGAGGGVFMAAFTFQHTVDDEIKSLRRELSGAYRRMTDRKAYAVIRRQYGIVGSVASLEVTHSFRHGWHPHRHVLYFTEKAVTDQDIFNLSVAFSALWRGVLVKTGRYSHDQRGVVLSNGNDQAGDYVCKWSMAHEMAKSPVKAGKDGGSSPFEMAQAWHDTGDHRYAMLLRDYAAAFKGSHQLTYSPGLKARLGIQDKSDQQIVADEQAQAVIMATLDRVSWKRIYIKRWRGVVLRAASTGKQDELSACLSRLGIDAAEVADDGHVIYRAGSP